ncbi:hypothetical protein B0H14DRAFT_2590744 [Mycena olivaceomarginata]|nr:hypothetical protein B0H14DRAFT_2590744 [Mycena olivaceomarginata]
MQFATSKPSEHVLGDFDDSKNDFGNEGRYLSPSAPSTKETDFCTNLTILCEKRTATTTRSNSLLADTNCSKSGQFRGCTACGVPPVPVDAPKGIELADDNKGIDAYFRNSIETIFYSVGGVDSKLNVYGVKNFNFVSIRQVMQPIPTPDALPSKLGFRRLLDPRQCQKDG